MSTFAQPVQRRLFTRVKTSYDPGFYDHTPIVGRRPRRVDILFDQAFPMHNDDYSTTNKVSGAGLFLASSLRQTDIDNRYRMFFLRIPLTHGPTYRYASYKQIIEVSPKPEPNFLILSLFNTNIRATVDEVNQLLDRSPNAFPIIGGPAVSASNNLEKLAKIFPPSTIFVKGAGEHILPHIIDCLSYQYMDTAVVDAATHNPEGDFFWEHGKGLPLYPEVIHRLLSRTLKGIYFKHHDFILHDEEVNTLTEEELRALRVDFSLQAEDVARRGNMRMFATRGCYTRYTHPKCCSFCSINHYPVPIAKTPLEYIDELRDIKAQIENGTLSGNARYLNYGDDDFLGNKAASLQFLRLLIAFPELCDYFYFDFQTSILALYKDADELISLLKKINLYKLDIGTDGFEKGTLRYLRKPYNMKMVSSVAAKLSRELPNTTQEHYVIFTYPQITPQELLATIRNLRELKRNNPTFEFDLGSNIFPCAIPGTKIYEDAPAELKEKNTETINGISVPVPFSLMPEDKRIMTILEEQLSYDNIVRELRRNGEEALIKIELLRQRKRMKNPTVSVNLLGWLTSKDEIIMYAALCILEKRLKRVIRAEKKSNP